MRPPLRSFVVRVRDAFSTITGVHITWLRQYYARTRMKGEVRFREVLTQFINGGSPVVIDVGAHRGESIAFYRSVFPAAQMISVEADPELVPILRTTYPDVTVVPFALSDQASTH